MKLNKLMMSLGLATAVLTGCNDSESDSSFAVTAIDGYIVNGLVTTTCSNGDVSATFTGTTDESGRAYINPTSEGITYTADECTSKVEGVAGTYDVDTPDESWEGNTMNSLPGLAVINPYTDMASTVLQVEGNESLSTEELKSKVLELLGYDDNYAYAAVLFEDFGANYTRNLSDNVEVALLAQAVFDVKTQLLTELAESGETRAIEYYTFTAEQFITFYEAVLPKVTGIVAKAIEDIESDGSYYTVKVNIPTSMTSAVVAAIETYEADGDIDALEVALASAVEDLTSQAQIVIISVTETESGTGADSTASQG